MKADGVISSSFRDPSGFLFYRDGSIYRQINTTYKENYDHLMNSHLYDTLVKSGLLIPYEEVDIAPEEPSAPYRVIKPQPIAFISYPYEWSFSQFKDAALTTLEIQKKALDFGMSLKDCSAYNIQFVNGKPVLIDTLSFEKYHQGKPWVAYRQFCQHFLAPLALMSCKDIRLGQLFRVYMDGVPLDLASALLPFRTWLKLSLLSHIHLHAKSQKYYADKITDTSNRKMTQLSFKGIIDNLESAIKKLSWHPEYTEWADYYKDTNYSAAAIEHKKKLVAEFLDQTGPKSVWDLGANDGLFSRIASDRGIITISFDIDPAAVEKNYLKCVEKNESNILPLLLDLTNQSPASGWQNEERLSLQQRGPVDTVFALALIHHLAISNNLPFNKIADFFKEICISLIVEFIPKTDSQVQRLLSTRKDIFPDYKQEIFESEFSRYFTIQRSVKIMDSERILYLMHRKDTKV
jgi:hypothetical protein